MAVISCRDLISWETQIEAESQVPETTAQDLEIGIVRILVGRLADMACLALWPSDAGQMITQYGACTYNTLSNKMPLNFIRFDMI